MDNNIKPKSETETDFFRDTNARYMGYSNEVGEAFRPLLPPKLVVLSYGTAIGYVCLDAYDKARKARLNGESKSLVAVRAVDVFTWQMLASVALPGVTINRITWFSRFMLSTMKANKILTRSMPTVIGLASIPLIISPIDHLVDYFMDVTYRKWFG